MISAAKFETLICVSNTLCMFFETHNYGVHINGHVILIRINLGSECDALGVPNVIVLLVGLRSQDLTSLFHNSSTGGHVPHQGHIRGPGTIGSRSGFGHTKAFCKLFFTIEL